MFLLRFCLQCFYLLGLGRFEGHPQRQRQTETGIRIVFYFSEMVPVWRKSLMRETETERERERERENRKTVAEEAAVLLQWIEERRRRNQ